MSLFDFKILIFGWNVSRTNNKSKGEMQHGEKRENAENLACVIKWEIKKHRAWITLL